jgi:hypothetical protein
MLLFFCLNSFIVVGTSIWVYTDAKAIGVRRGQITGVVDMNPGEWLLACLLIWILGFPFYLAYRKEFMRINGKLPGYSTPIATLALNFDEQLRKLAKLRDEKILSDEEFERKKQEILGMTAPSITQQVIAQPSERQASTSAQPATGGEFSLGFRPILSNIAIAILVILFVAGFLLAIAMRNGS